MTIPLPSLTSTVAPATKSLTMQVIDSISIYKASLCHIQDTNLVIFKTLLILHNYPLNIMYSISALCIICIILQRTAESSGDSILYYHHNFKICIFHASNLTSELDFIERGEVMEYLQNQKISCINHLSLWTLIQKYYSLIL